jgi:hypothetical protein
MFGYRGGEPRAYGAAQPSRAGGLSDSSLASGTEWLAEILREDWQEG